MGACWSGAGVGLGLLLSLCDIIILNHFNLDSFLFQLDLSWTIPVSQQEVLESFARRDLRIRWARNMTVGEAILNTALLYTSAPPSPVLSELARPGIVVSQNNPERNFVYSIGPLSYISLGTIFTVSDALTGALAYAGTTQLNSRYNKSLPLQLIVTDDRSGLQDTVSFSVKIIDTNNHSPYFVTNPVSLQVFENSPPGTLVGLIFAEDDDISFPELIYGWNGTPPSEFGLEAITQHDTGALRYGVEVYTKEVLDREAQAQYHLGIQASDKVNAATSAALRIRVMDENDHPPRFQTGLHCLSSTNNGCTVATFTDRPEDTVIGTLLGSLAAEDQDEGPNSQMRFSLIVNT